MREAMFNDGVTGTASRIQLPTGRITRLRGLMIDVDPGKLIPDNPLFPPAEDPREFFGRIQAVLDRHPLVRDAEVRSTGTGLHLLLWFEPPVELEDAGGQRRWDGLIRLTQATLPSDPNAPGITALTRPVGSINSKNGARVEKIRRGSPVDPQRVVEFAAQVKAAPFRVVAGILLGSERVTPCPICSGARSALAALDHAGRCYGCGSVSLATLYGAILAAEGAGRGRGRFRVGPAPGVEESRPQDGPDVDTPRVTRPVFPSEEEAPGRAELSRPRGQAPLIKD